MRLGGISKKSTVNRNRSPKTKLWGGQSDIVREMRRNQQRRRYRRNSQRKRKPAVLCSGSQMRKGFQGGKDLLSNAANGSIKKELQSTI